MKKILFLAIIGLMITQANALITVECSGIGTTINLTAAQNNITELWTNASNQAVRMGGFDTSISNLWTNASNQDARIKTTEDKFGTLTDTKWCTGTATGFQCVDDAPTGGGDYFANVSANQANITNLWSNASIQESLIADRVKKAGDTMTGALYVPELGGNSSGLLISSSNDVQIVPAGDDLQLFGDRYTLWDTDLSTAANGYIFRIGDAAIGGSTSFYLASAERAASGGSNPQAAFAFYTKNGSVAANYIESLNNDFKLYTRSAGGGPAGDIYFEPAGGDVLPVSTKNINLGSASLSWDNCYCDDYVTTSRGFTKNKNISSIDIVSKIKTLGNGEIDHTTVDSSLYGGGNDSISINSVIFANSDSIRELAQKIDDLYLRIQKIESTLCGDKHMEYCPGGVL